MTVYLYLQFDPLDIVSKKPHTVVLMLDSPEEHVLQSACEALYKFAEKCKLDSLSLIVAVYLSDLYLFMLKFSRNLCGKLCFKFLWRIRCKNQHEIHTAWTQRLIKVVFS